MRSPRDSAISTIPRNTSAKTASNAAMSAVERSRLTRARPVQLLHGPRQVECYESREPHRLIRRDGDALVAEPLAEVGEQRRVIGTYSTTARSWASWVLNILQHRAQCRSTLWTYPQFAHRVPARRPSNRLGRPPTAGPARAAVRPPAAACSASVARHPPPHDLGRTRCRRVLDPVEKTTAFTHRAAPESLQHDNGSICVARTVPKPRDGDSSSPSNSSRNASKSSSARSTSSIRST